MRPTLAAGAAAAALALGAWPAHAASAPQLHVQAGYAGVPVSPGLWVPVTVRVDGGDGGVQGTLRVTPPTASGAPGVAEQVDVDVPAAQTRTITVAVQSAAGTVRAELRDGGGARVAAATATLAAGGEGHVVVAVVSDAAGAFDGAAGTYVLGSATQQLDVVRLGVAQVPDAPQLLRTFTEVIVDGVATGGLSSAQRGALSAYVAAGGGLLLTGGGAAAQVVDGIPADVVPATAGGVDSVALPGAAAALCTAAPPPPEAVAESRLSLAPGATPMLRDTAGNPVVAVLALGLGRSVMTAFDPAAPPLAGWAGQGCLERALVSAALPGRRAEISMEPTTPRGARGATVGQVADTTTIPPGLLQGATGMARVVPPSTALLGLALGGYVVVAGPLAAVVPRRRRRRTVLWGVLPALAIGLGVAAWTTGLGVAQVDAAMTQVRVIDVPGSAAGSNVTSLAALSLPRGGTGTLYLQPGALVAAAGAEPGRATHSGDRLEVSGAPAGSVAAVVVDGHGPRIGRGLDQALRWADDTHLAGTLTNHLGAALDDVTLLGSDGSTTALGSLADGATVRAEVVAETAYGGLQSAGGGCTTVACLGSGPRAQLLDALDAWTEERHPGVPALFGVARGPLLPTGGVRTLDTVVVPLDAPDGAGAPLPVRGLAAHGFESGGVVTGASVTLRDGDAAVLDVPVPPGAASVTVTPLSGSCWTYGCVDYRLVPNHNPLPPELFYEWLDPAAGSWRALPMALDATGHRAGVLPAARLAGADLVLRLRSQNLAVSLAAPDIRVTGVQP